jgi:hypothetical protein
MAASKLRLWFILTRHGASLQILLSLNGVGYMVRVIVRKIAVELLAG